MLRGGIILGLTALLLSGCYIGLDSGADGGGPDSNGGTEGEETGGESEDTGGTDGEEADGPFDCDPDTPVTALPLRRLSAAQYRNAIEDLVAWAIGNGADAAVDALQPVLDLMPADARTAPGGAPRGGFLRLDQAVHQEHIDGAYTVGEAVGALLAGDHLEAIAGTCATDGDAGNDATCLDDFIRGFGARAYRRPLTEDEVTAYHEVFDADGLTSGMEPVAFADVITVMLNAPEFLYMVEHGGDEVEGEPGVYRLTAWELASRLSFHFWQTSPDDELLAAADSGELLTDDGYRAQVERLFADGRTTAALEAFYGGWLWLDATADVSALVGNPVYDAMRGSFEPTPETTEAIVQEVLDMATYYTNTDGTFADLFRSDRSFARTADLAELYGVQPWDGGTPPRFPDGERAGLLTRAAFVAAESPHTRPVMKGIRIREGLLCGEIPPPPPGAADNPPSPSEGVTTRDSVEMASEAAGTVCATCHLPFINHLGYATENYDPLGRHRTEEVLFDDEGNEVGRLPVDTESTPQVVAGDDSVSTGASDLTELILDSEEAEACFARNYLRFTFGREEELDRDGCVLNAVFAAAREGEPLADALRRIALRDEFKTRWIEE